MGVDGSTTANAIRARKVDPVKTIRLTPEELAPAIQALLKGEVVAFPTETVYGLGAHGLRADAVARIFAVKGRPADNPLILHVLDQKALRRLTVDDEMDPAAIALTEAFWPGPLTVVVPAAPTIPREVTAGLPTVAVRAPSHPVARALIAGVGVPIAAPSANLSGRPSPTTFAAVWEDLAGRVPYIIDGGRCAVGVESTVVDCTTRPVTILRPGGISVEMVASVVGEVQYPHPGGPARAPGMKYRHYAPKKELIWVVGSETRDLVRARGAELSSYRTLAVIAPHGVVAPPEWPSASLGADEVSAAHELFSAIRRMDQTDAEAIVVMWSSLKGLGQAVANRLEKAASMKVE
ncbi:MAG: L-threonylcarbamoyladenylate synthase [Firmicutes bacterium]|nr:L-threonylcarbamoyladenylate synthase [Bacillota bacterium]